MLVNFINLSLIFSASIFLILIWLLIRQKVKTPMVKIYAFLIALLALDTLTMLHLFNGQFPELSSLWGKLHFALAGVILAVLHYFTSSFTYTRDLPKLSIRETGVFSLGIFIGFLPILDIVRSGTVAVNGHFMPRYSAYYWFLIAFFALVVVSGGVAIYQRFQKTTHPSESANRRLVLFGVFPLTVLLLGCVYILPYFDPREPFWLCGYASMGMLLYLGAARFHILEITERNQYVLPQFAVGTLFLSIYYLRKDIISEYSHLIFSIPFLIACTLIGYYLLYYFTIAFKKVQVGYDELLDRRMEQFSTEILKFINRQQLWEYLAKFCREYLNISKIAIITLENDITPYQIAHLEGFSESDIKSLLSAADSPLLDELENRPRLINKTNLSRESELFKTMDRLKIYLGLPLIEQNEIIGIILLGGERRYMPVSRRNALVFKMMSSQIAVAVENIRTIENMFQAQKMAGLGMLASQVAHDFRSFISLVKLQNKENSNSRLLKHANYMEKMVEDLLNYARPQELKFTNVYIDQLIDMTLEMVDVPGDVEIQKLYADGLPKIPLDIGQMRRVFTNLFENSIRAMRVSEGRRLKITTHALRSRSKFSPHQWVHIEIFDEGVGIPEEYLERIFDPFFTTYKTEGGNGFGLAIVKQIIRRHSGYIEVSSRPGRGTVFNIRLPYQNV